jgi:PAS domain S-box-containing protein
MESWPQALKTALGIIVSSKYPMYLAWGEAFTQFYNDAYRPILGATKHPDALGRSTRFSFPEIWDVISPMFTNVMEHGVPSYFEDLLLPLHRNGFLEECYFNFCYSAIYGELGQVAGVFVTCEETTRRVISERRLKTARNLLAKTTQARSVKDVCSGVFEALRSNRECIPFVVLYLTDLNGQRAQLAETTGLKDAHSLPVHIDLDKDRLWGLEVRMLTDRSGIHSIDMTPFEQDLLPSPWGEMPAQAVALALPGQAADGTSGYLISGLSPRLAFDDAYREFLQSIADQIVVSLASARVHEDSEKRAEALAQLNRAKTTFFSNVSHEFRTPLTLSLDPLTRMLEGEMGKFSPRQLSEIKLVHRNTLRLLKLVNTLLDLSRMEAIGYPVNRRPVELTALTRELAEVFRSAIEVSGLQLRIECQPLEKVVLVDTDIWEKVVLNLISNALKFTFAGEIRVSLEYAGDTVVFQVADTGVGIALADQPHIFERFFRQDYGRARSHEGSGIGLALVLDLVEAHGGTIELESQLDRGSTFTVRLPLEVVTQDREVVQTVVLAANTRSRQAFLSEAEDWLAKQLAFSPQANPANALIPSTPARILVVDDHVQMCDYLVRILSPYWEIETASNGQAALEMMQSSPPQLVLTDIMMPGLDGLSFVKEIRRHPELATIPVILLSARAGLESSVEGMEVGADDYLVKPFQAEELISRIRARLQVNALRQRLFEARQAEVDDLLIAEIVDGINDPFFVVDRTGHLIYLNTAAEDLWGAPRAELLNQALDNLQPESVVGSFIRQYLGTILEGEPVEPEVTLAAFERWYQVRVSSFSQGSAFYWVDITERKLAEEAQQQTKNLLQTILDALPVGVWVADREGQLFLHNPAGYNLWGGAEMVGVDQYDHYRGWHVGTSRPLESHEWGMARALQGESCLNEMVEILTFDDVHKVILHSAVPIRDAAGEVNGGIVVTQDITSWHAVEQQARTHQVFVTAISEITELLIGTLDLDTVLRRILQSVDRVVPHDAARIFLIEGDRLIAKYENYQTDRIMPLPTPRLSLDLAPFQTMLKTGQPVMISEFDPVADWLGHPDCSACVGAPILAKADTIGFLILESAASGFFQPEDLDRLNIFADQAAIAIENARLYSEVREHAAEMERRVVERTAELLRAKEHVEAILNSSSDAIALVTEHGRIEQVNPAFLRMFQVDEVALDATVDQFVMPEELRNLRLQVEHASMTKQSVQFEVLCQRRGKPFYTEIGMAALPQQNQQEQLLVCAVRDISLRKRVEENLRRTLEKEQELAQMKSRFVSMVSHEFRTPLAVIQTSSDMLLHYSERMLPERRLDALQRIQSEIVHLRDMLDELLTHYRAESVGLDIRRTPINLREFSQRAINQVQHAFPVARTVKARFAAGCDEVEVDPALFERILVNLLSNALKYSPEDQPVELEATCVDGQLVLQIRDFGIGIPEKNLPQLFEPFFRADNVGDLPGTGLGLATVKAAVEAHGGTITVASVLNAGTTFRITMPV